MSRALRETLVGLVLIAGALTALISINTMSGSSFQSGREAPMTFRTFPTILSSGLAILSTIFTIGAVRRLIAEHRQQAGVAPEGRPGIGSVVVPVLVVVLLVAYAVLLKVVPFAPLTWAFLFLGFYVFGQRRVIRNAIVALCATAGFYGIFVYVLELPLEP